MKKVLFAGRATAEACGPFADWAVISLAEPDSAEGEPRIAEGWHSVLRLSFHDITPATNGDGYYIEMTAEDARQIVEFVRKVAPEVDGVLVHCRAGISRSAAVAKWICGQHRIPFSSRYRKFNEHVYQLLVEAERENQND